MRILYLSSEAAPFVKVGGLGDVAGSYPNELDKAGEEIIQILPYHKVIDLDGYRVEIVFRGEIDFGWETIRYQVNEIEVGSRKTWFISGKFISDDDQVYGANDLMKYGFFSLASIDAIMGMGWKPDIVHANDWHAALSLYAMRKMKNYKQFYENTSSILTIHNLPYLGSGIEKVLDGFGIEQLDDELIPDWGRVMPLPIGIANADWITTVSDGYAGEMQTKEFGSGIHVFMKKRENIISGILNGLDIDAWNPETDNYIDQKFSINTFELRHENKKYLLENLGFPGDLNKPLISIISRLDYQKGIDIAVDAMSKLDELDFYLIILGTGDPRIKEQLLELEKQFPDNIKVYIKYDEALAHQIYSGTDMILIPSRYEPCGLTQMIGMRYGCIPIAANTGGLKDTVIDVENGLGSATGFLFDKGSEESLLGALISANSLYSDTESWKKLQINGMKKDFSWKRSIEKFQDLYKMLNEKRKQ